MMPAKVRPTNLKELRDSGWTSKTVKQEIRDNFLRMLQQGEELFPGIIGYENTVIPEVNLALPRTIARMSDVAASTSANAPTLSTKTLAPTRAAISTASVHPIKPDVKAMATATTPACRSES